MQKSSLLGAFMLSFLGGPWGKPWLLSVSPAGSSASLCLAVGLGQGLWCKDSPRDGKQPCPSGDAEGLGCPVH